MSIDVYQLMDDFGDHRVRDRILDLRKSGSYSQTPSGNAVAADIGGELVKSLKAWRDQTKLNDPSTLRIKALLESLGVERSCALAVRFITDRLCSPDANSDIGSLRAGLAGAILAEEQWGRFSEERFHWSKHEIKKGRIRGRRARSATKSLSLMRPDLVSDWSRTDGYLLSSTLINHIIRGCSSVRVEVVRRPVGLRSMTRAVTRLRWTEEVEKWLADKDNFLRASRPMALPLLEPPLDWGIGKSGGYATGPLAGRSIMTCRARQQRELFDASNVSSVYDAVNTLQRTAWEINPLVYEAFRSVMESGISGAGFVTSPPVKPVFPELGPEASQKEQSLRRRSHRRAMRAWTVANDEWGRNRLRLARTLSVGRIYNGAGSLYFPHRVDFRGRAYPTSGSLSYQGPDYQRAMLRFATPKQIETQEAKDYFFYHGANCFGFDKVTRAEQKQWVLDNQEMIVAVAEDPLDRRDWLEADKPFMFLAWCEEAEILFRTGSLESRIATSVDGSNNGLQIYSLLLRDEVSGAATNCVPGSRPRDIYQDVADLLTQRLAVAARGVGESAGRASDVLKFCERTAGGGIPRKAVKRSVMTLPYGSTSYSSQNYMCDWYHEHVRGKDMSDNERYFRFGSYDTMTWLGGLLWEVIGEVVVSAMSGMEYLRGVAAVANAQNKHVDWITPLGMPVTQHYLRGTTKVIQFYGGGVIRVRLWEPDGRVHSLRSSNGICPNFVHSLDASAMMLTVQRAREAGIQDFQMIHDSFGTHASDLPTLDRVLRESYKEIFTPDILGLNHERWSSILGDIPPLPKYGSLDINKLTDSDYFFA